MPTYKENLDSIMNLSLNKPDGFRTEILDKINDCMEEQAIEYLNGCKKALARTIFN